MINIPGIRPSMSGFTCTRCTRSYPSLYWFKRDTDSKRAFCLECAGDLPPRQLEDVVQAPGTEIGGQRESPDLASYMGTLAFGLVAGLLIIKDQELLQLVSRWDPRLGRLPWSAVVFGTIVAASTLLIRLTATFMASWSSKMFRSLRGNKDAS